MTVGLLIVNGDDWGLRHDTTEAIFRCFESGGVSSTTGMVYMADSDRAAELANEASLPVGLHLNLTAELTSPSAGASVRERHEAIRRHFAPRSARWRYSPFSRKAIADAIGDQLKEFERLYGRPPTHVDGHHHIQACPDVFLSSAFGPGTRMRLAHSFPPGRSPLTKRMARSLVNAVIARRYQTARRFFSLRDLYPPLGGEGLDDVLELAKSSPVEIMVHPAREDEQEVLTSARWIQLLRAAAPASYGCLPPAGSQG